MNSRFRLVVSCAALLLAACAGPATGQQETATTVAPDVSTTAVAPMTTTTEATTTTAPPASTTVAPSEGDVSALWASLDSGSEITSARMEGSIEMTGLDAATTGLSDGVILFSTSFDTVTGNNSFLMDMSSMVDAMEPDETDPFGGLAAGMFGEIESRQIGDTVYLKFPLFTAMFGAETEWVSMPAEEGDEFTGGFETMPTDPNEVIETFDDAGATVEVIGVENVNGVDATHYMVSLDTETMELTPEEEAEMAASGLFAGGVIPLELWISDEGHMVRMIMEIDGTGVEAAPGEEFDTMTMRYDVFDINGDLVIEAPPPAAVTPLADLEDGFSFEG